MRILKVGMMSVSIVCALVARPMPAEASIMYAELGDAGDSVATAQAVVATPGGALESVTGELGSVSDLDFFRFWVTASTLRIETGPYTNTPFPTNTFPGFELQTATGESRGGASYLNSPAPFGPTAFIDFGSASFEFGSSHIVYKNLVPGEYVLRVDGAGQVNNPQPRYVGDYSIRFVGAETLQPVPEPSTLTLGLLAATGWFGFRRRATSRRAA